jgi:DNA gyrase subunit A
MGRATSGVSGMKFRSEDDSVLSMSVIRAAQAAAEESDENVQYVFTITDGGFAKRSRISEYRLTNRGGLGVRAMALANEDRGGLVGGFIVEDGDEVLAITQSGQVVRSPINENFRPTGRSTMGVKFVSPKSGDSVVVVARSVEAKVIEEVTENAEADEAGSVPDDAAEGVVDSGAEGTADAVGSSDVAADVTIEETAATETTDDTGESEG